MSNNKVRYGYNKVDGNAQFKLWRYNDEAVQVIWEGSIEETGKIEPLIDLISEYEGKLGYTND